MIAAGAPERVAKRIARSGFCSRRDAERLIAAGRVAVDGEVLTSPAVTVTAANLVTVDGEPLPAAEPARLFRYHKPAGVLTAARDPEGRPTIYDRLPDGLPRLMPIGRLDMGSEGLLLLTNDGELKRRLELPSTGWLRRYRVRVHGRIDEARLEALEGRHRDRRLPVRPDPGRARPGPGQQRLADRGAARGQEPGDPPRPRAFRLAGEPSDPLSFGPFQLGGLAVGAIEEVPAKVLQEQLGARLAAGIAARGAEGFVNRRGAKIVGQAMTWS